MSRWREWGGQDRFGKDATVPRHERRRSRTCSLTTNPSISDPHPSVGQLAPESGRPPLLSHGLARPRPGTLAQLQAGVALQAAISRGRQAAAPPPHSNDCRRVQACWHLGRDPPTGRTTILLYSKGKVLADYSNTQLCIPCYVHGPIDQSGCCACILGTHEGSDKYVSAVNVCARVSNDKALADELKDLLMGAKRFVRDRQ